MMLRRLVDSFVQHKMNCLVLLVLVFICFPSIIKCCSPPGGPIEPDTVEKTVFYADAVVSGIVLRHYKLPNNLPSLFTAEMALSCIFKGGPMPQYVNITQAGFNPGMCFSTTLTVGKNYVVYLRKAGPTYTPSDMEVEVTGTNDPFMQNITRVCDLNTMHPEGTDPALVDCPQTLGQPKCVRYQDSPGETSLPPEITTDTLKEFTSPEDNKDDQNTANGSGKRSKNGASSRGMETMIVTLLCGALVLVL